MPLLFTPLLRLFDLFGSPVLAIVFLTLLWLQWKYPLRRQHLQTFRRVTTNLVFAVPSFLTLRLLLIPIPLAVAAWAARHDFGLLNWLHPPPLVAAVVSILLLDYIYYWWHVATHLVPFLWRFHNVHHTDLDLDVSTATRFHVVELLLSVIWRAAVVAMLGIAPLALLVFEFVFEAAGQFHHSNWRLHPAIERALNRIFVTPRMHGIHHSIVLHETNSNWGTIFSWWDRLHRSLRLDVPQEAITIGVPAWRDAKELTVVDLFQMPFRKQRPWQLPHGEQPQRAATQRNNHR